jgi:hypothetical protein
MRKGLLLVAIVLVAAACGGSNDSVAEAGTASPDVAAETTAAPEATAPTTDGATTDEPADTPATTAAAAPSFDGPPAPDFELDLNDGTTFTLAGEEKPVFMVFWAEW